MEIGKMNKRITFKTYSETENELGDSISTWMDYKTVWASVSNLHGREYFTAMQVQAENTVKFTIRYCKDINTSMKIVFNNQIYDIKFIDNIKYGNKFMEIQGLVVI
jgi:SPP1 family predicted phage head-tail adaptor